MLSSMRSGLFAGTSLVLALSIGCGVLIGCGAEDVPLDASMRMDAGADGDIGSSGDGGAIDAATFDPDCLARCATCSIAYCDVPSGWCASDRAPCIAASSTCDELVRCIEGPHPLSGLAVCEDGVLAAMTLERIAPLARDTDSYRPPSMLVRERIGLALEALAAMNIGLVRDHASAAGYIVCRGIEDEDGLVLLRPMTPGSGHASIVVRALGDVRGLVLEAPHPLWDMGTLEESVTIFSATDARALIASGTHRCASDTPSGCTGTADACGTGAPVRESDMAHAVDSVFHAAHAALTTAYPEDWFLSVHGFGGPGISVSNGTNDPAPIGSRSARLAIALHTRFGDEVTTCNDFGDPAITTDERLCGTNNVQGRLLNGSAAECTASASAATDRFAHMEQSAEYRPERAAEVAAAVLEALDAP